MLEALDVIRFGDEFKQWVRVLVTDTFSSVNHDGWISDTIPLKCGIRQGCPFSPLVFTLAVELQAIKIQNSTISGIKLPSNKNEASRLKIRQMADDTTLFLHNKEDMIEAKSTINTFSLFSGLRLNAKKPKVMKLSSRKNEREEASLPFITVERIKILGIVFENEETDKKGTKLDRKTRKNETYYTAMEEERP